MNEKRDIREIVLTIVGVVVAVLIAAEWTLLYLINSGIINVTK